MTLLLVLVVVVATIAARYERRLMARRANPPSDRMRAWAAAALADGPTRNWLSTLEVDELKALYKELRQFSRRNRVDVDLLWHGSLADNPPALRELSAMTQEFLQAARRRAALEAELVAHIWFAEFRKSPGWWRNRALLPDLHARLLRAGLAEPLPTSLWMQLPLRRRQALRDGILAAAEKDRAAFNVVLKKALAAQRAAEMAPLTGGESAEYT